MKTIPREAFWMQISALAPVYVNSFQHGCSSGWTANALLFFQQGNEVAATSLELSLIASSSDIGQMILAIPGGILVDKFGKKKVIIAAGFWFLISWFLLSFTSSVNIIILARFFSGIAIALVNSTTSITVGEIASPGIRAQLVSIDQIFFGSGMIFQSIISILFNSYFFLSYCPLALACAFFITLLWILETPHHLISVSKSLQARKNLERIRPGYTEEEIDYEFNGMKTYILGEKKAKEQLHWIEFLKSKSIREPLITATLVSFFAFATGIGLISSYSTAIIPENDFVPSKYYPVILAFAPFILNWFTPIYVEKFPRRTLFQMGAALIGLLHMVLALTNYCFAQLHINLCGLIFTFAILLLTLISRGSVELMHTALKSELFPQSVKGLGSSLCVIAQSVANILLYQFYTLLTANLGQYFVFVVLATNSLILYLLVYFRLPEARGQYLADLQTCPNETTPIKSKIQNGTLDDEKI